jgi:hypothetical protein
MLANVGFAVVMISRELAQLHVPCPYIACAVENSRPLPCCPLRREASGISVRIIKVKIPPVIFGQKLFQGCSSTFAGKRRTTLNSAKPMVRGFHFQCRQLDRGGCPGCWQRMEPELSKFLPWLALCVSRKGLQVSNESFGSVIFRARACGRGK